MKTNTLPLRLRNGVIKASDDSITIGSHFDVSGARQFARAVARVAKAKPSYAIIDLSRTREVDSSGFGALVSGLRRLGEHGAKPIVVCANSSVRRLMDFAGIARAFTIVDRVSEARHVIAKAAADETAAMAS
jgi:anti-sigma B factor antagonist